MKRTHFAASAFVFVLTFAVTSVSSLTAMTSYGARKKISSISIIVEGETVVGESIQDQELTIEPKSENSRYSVNSYEFLNTGFSWSEDDIPELKVELEAENGYYFSVSKESIRVSGAEFVSQKKDRDSELLFLTIKMPPLAEQTQRIEKAWWGSTSEANWSPSIGAGSYEVKLYRNGKTVGQKKVTTDTTYDFSFALTRPGTYSFKVRPVNKVKPENKGQQVASEDKTIDEETAAKNRAMNATQTKGKSEALGEWLQDAAGWWYRNPDGGCTKDNWQSINGKWYFFGPDGYMMTGWIEWNGKLYYCDTTNGDMLTDAVAPGGHLVGPDGARVD